VSAASKQDPGWQVPAYTAPVQRPKCHAFCVVVPVINEGPRIARLLQRMQAQQVASVADLVLVDGGSTDSSLAPATLTAAGVNTLLVKQGPGKLSAQLRCAYAWALQRNYAGVVTIDGNDKDDPGAIPAFIAALEEGFDFVQASRYVAGGQGHNVPRSRDMAIRYLHAPLLAWASGHPWTDTTQGFRAYSARVLRDPHVAPFRNVFVTYELLAYLSYRIPRLGYRCTELPTTRRYPQGAVPSKIAGWRGNLDLLRTLLRACRGGYNPKNQ
jgi:dolichol-phosphate mannosyltransferase